MDDDGNEATIPIELSSPNVNVRLLPMVAWSAEATVFLSDQVNRDTNGNGLPDILDDFYHRIGFSKLGSYTDGIYQSDCRGFIGVDGVAADKVLLRLQVNRTTPHLPRVIRREHLIQPLQIPPVVRVIV